MQTITVNEGQTLKDIATARLGDASRMVELALLNGINPTDDLVIDSKLVIPDVAIEKMAMVEEFTKNKNIPASALETTIELDPLDWDVFYGLHD